MVGVAGVSVQDKVSCEQTSDDHALETCKVVRVILTFFIHLSISRGG